MHLTIQQVIALTENALRGFMSLAIPEGLYLDYKEGLSGTSEKDAKREFLKDVTAFRQRRRWPFVLRREGTQGRDIHR